MIIVWKELEIPLMLLVKKQQNVWQWCLQINVQVKRFAFHIYSLRKSKIGVGNRLLDVLDWPHRSLQLEDALLLWRLWSDLKEPMLLFSKAHTTLMSRLHVNVAVYCYLALRSCVNHPQTIRDLINISRQRVIISATNLIGGRPHQRGRGPNNFFS